MAVRTEPSNSHGRRSSPDDTTISRLQVRLAWRNEELGDEHSRHGHPSVLFTDDIQPSNDEFRAGLLAVHFST